MSDLEEALPNVEQILKDLDFSKDEGLARAILKRHGVDEKTAGHIAAHHFQNHRGDTVRT